MSKAPRSCFERLETRFREVYGTAMACVSHGPGRTELEATTRPQQRQVLAAASIWKLPRAQPCDGVMRLVLLAGKPFVSSSKT